MDRLPQYLLETAYGKAISDQLAKKSSIPAWVTSSLLVGSTGPDQHTPETKDEGDSSQTSNSDYMDSESDLVEFDMSDAGEEESEEAPLDIRRSISSTSSIDSLGSDDQPFVMADDVGDRTDQLGNRYPLNFVDEPTRAWLHNQPSFVDGKSSGEEPMPLPTAWARSTDGNLVTLGRGPTTSTPVYVRTNNPIPRLCGIYYFEVSIYEDTGNNGLSIGICTEASPMRAVPGSDNHSWALHSDDGRVQGSQLTARDFCEKFGPGSTVGCGINFVNDSIFFTLNGFDLGTPFSGIKTTPRMYPTLAVGTGMLISANFGQRKFKFDIGAKVSDEKATLKAEISAVKPDNQLSAPLNKLVLNYFMHFGYAKSASILKQQLGAEQPANASLDVGESFDLRKTIREYILAQSFEEAYALLSQKHPKVLANYPEVGFGLKSRAFVKATGEPDLERAIEMGRQLRLNFQDSEDSTIIFKLHRALAFMAYTDATKCEYYSMFGPESLPGLAEEVNRAILASQGLPDVALLPKLALRSYDLARKLADVDSQSTFLNIDTDYLV